VSDVEVGFWLGVVSTVTLGAIVAAVVISERERRADRLDRLWREAERKRGVR
jgi:hypothetical protein